MEWFLVFILIGAAGGAGSVVRALLTRFDGWLPYGLFLANSLAAGLVGWLVVGSTLSAGYLTLTTAGFAATVGFAGGLSTFSTAMKASFDFYHRGRLVQSAITLVGNLFIPMVALMLAAVLR
jgi:fluoride ion exporter CrcB/FEX